MASWGTSRSRAADATFWSYLRPADRLPPINSPPILSSQGEARRIRRRAVQQGRTTDLAALQRDDAIGRADGFRAMGNDDAGDVQRGKFSNPSRGKRTR